jgi:hypothetical protein
LYDPALLGRISDEKAVVAFLYPGVLEFAILSATVLRRLAWAFIPDAPVCIIP